MHVKRISSALVIVALIGCNQPTPDDAERARSGIVQRAEEQPDSVPDLIQPRVPSATAGDTGWKYAQRVSADLDGDGKEESAVLIADVSLDARGAPLWEDGHRWQVYVQEPDGKVTRLYARFLPNGKLTAYIAAPQGGVRPTIVLLEQMPDHLAVYEVRYRGPGEIDVWQRVNSSIDRALSFQGSPAP
jgi:hypothetical protein